MIVGSDYDVTGPKKDRLDVIIDSEELMVEIDDIVLLFEDFDDIVAFEGFPIFPTFLKVNYLRRISNAGLIQKIIDI